MSTKAKSKNVAQKDSEPRPLSPKELRETQEKLIAGEISGRPEFIDGREPALSAVVGKKSITLYARIARGKREKLGKLGYGEQRAKIADMRVLARNMRDEHKRNSAKTVKQLARMPAEALTLREFLDTYYFVETAVDGGYRSKDVKPMKELQSEFKWLMDRNVMSITVGDIEQWRDTKRMEIKYDTKRKFYSYLKGMYNYGVRKKLLSYNPVSGVHFVDDTEIRYRALDDDELSRILDVVNGSYMRDRVYVILSMITGARPSEVMRIRIEEIDWKHNRIRVPRAFSNATMHKRRESKSGKVRYLTIDDEVARLIREFIESERRTEGWLFLNQYGKQLKSFRTQWATICRNADVVCTLYDLRHTFATKLLESTSNIYTVMQMMGHSDISTTQKYLHGLADQYKETAETIRSKFGITV